MMRKRRKVGERDKAKCVVVVIFLNIQPKGTGRLTFSMNVKFINLFLYQHILTFSKQLWAMFNFVTPAIEAFYAFCTNAACN